MAPSASKSSSHRSSSHRSSSVPRRERRKDVRKMKDGDGGADGKHKKKKSKKEKKSKRSRSRDAKTRLNDDDGRDPGSTNAEAGPGPSTSAHRAQTAAAPGSSKFDFGEDFVAFGFDDDEGQEDGEEQEIGGKGEEEKKDEGRGRKRKPGEYEREDRRTVVGRRDGARTRLAPWAELMDTEGCTNVASLLHREVDAFVRYMAPTHEEDEVRALTVEMITRAIVQRFPDAQVLPFGSYETKLYLPLGDIDLVVLSRSMAHSDRVTVLHALATTLRRAGVTNKVTIIAKAKVPIIKFVTTHGGIAVDVSLNQANGVAAGRMVAGFVHAMPAVRALVLVTKAFLAQRGMNEVFTGGLGSYAIVCLAVSFLQMHPKVRRGEIDPSRNLGTLVLEFFELYGCYFNYNETGISVRDGGMYFSKRARGWVDARNKGLLSIEDPGDIANDISKGSYNIHRVRQTFAGAHGILTARAFTEANILSQRRAGKTVNLRGGSGRRGDPAEHSVLSHILGITQETINHRRLTKELYDKRTLHGLLGVAPRATAAAEKEDGKKDEAVAAAVADGSRRGRGGKGAQSVRAAWTSAHASDDETVAAAAAKAVEVEDEDEGRYAIPRKRRRVGTTADTHTVFVPDAEDVVVETLSDADSLVAEELAYASASSSSSSTSSTRLSRQRRRAYWAAKAARGMAGSE